MNNEKEFRSFLQEDPTIVAIMDDRLYRLALESKHRVVFLLDATISNLRERVERLLEADKLVFVHIDMVAGLTSTSAVVDFIADLFLGQVGIISTKQSVIKRANQKGIRSIYRGFMVDTKSKNMFKDNLKSGIRPDAVEIMPAFVEKVISELVNEFPSLTVIAGGLITEKKEAYSIINSGASAVSTSCLEILKE